MNKLFISPAAQEDLIEIKRYITEKLGNPISANKVVIRITKRLKDLIDFPQSGAIIRNFINGHLAGSGSYCHIRQGIRGSRKKCRKRAIPANAAHILKKSLKHMHKKATVKAEGYT